MAIEIGDLVVRKSYQKDLVFRVVGFDDDQALLKGVDLRLMADAPLDDLEKVDADQQHFYRSEVRMMEEESIRLIHQNKRLRDGVNRFKHLNYYRDTAVHFEYPGKVLHIDGDKAYLDKCLNRYAELGVPALGFHVSEKEIPKVLPDYINAVQPDILVITGHDGILKKKSRFIQAGFLSEFAPFC
jgi:spore coat assembly protein